MKCRITSNGKARRVPREKPYLYIDPINSEPNQDVLVNIVTGQVVAHPSVNVDNGVGLGTKQMKTFENG